jgi:hypothetical protein
MVMEGLSSFKGGSMSSSRLRDLSLLLTAIELLKIELYNKVIWLKTRGKGGE